MGAALGIAGSTEREAAGTYVVEYFDEALWLLSSDGSCSAFGAGSWARGLPVAEL
jgi:hypothetical protein